MKKDSNFEVSRIRESKLHNIQMGFFLCPFTILRYCHDLETNLPCSRQTGNGVPDFFMPLPILLIKVLNPGKTCQIELSGQIY